MNRRDAIKRTGFALGYAVSASAIAAVMNGCVADSATEAVEVWKPSFLKEGQVSLVAEIAERILPATDTPGAKDVNVHQFIDTMLNGFATQPVKDAFTKGLNQFAQDCQSKFSSSFEKCSNEQRDQLLTEYMKTGAEEAKKTDDEDAPKPFFNTIKEWTLLGYFTSEKVGSEVLNFDPVPGEYNGCIDLADVNGRIWTHR